MVFAMKLPLKITRHEESFAIRDAAGTSICYIYFGVSDETQRFAAQRMTRAEAKDIAKQIARALMDGAETKKAAASPEASGG
jgi:hypothetical protein